MCGQRPALLQHGDANDGYRLLDPAHVNARLEGDDLSAVRAVARERLFETHTQRRRLEREALEAQARRPTGALRYLVVGGFVLVGTEGPRRSLDLLYRHPACVTRLSADRQTCHVQWFTTGPSGEEAFTESGSLTTRVVVSVSGYADASAFVRAAERALEQPEGDDARRLAAQVRAHDAAAGAEGETYEVAQVLGKKRNRDGVVVYLVLWRGYPPSEATWEPVDNFNNTVQQWVAELESNGQVEELSDETARRMLRSLTTPGRGVGRAARGGRRAR